MSDTKEKIKGVPETSDENVISSGSANRKGGKKKSALVTNESGALVSGKAEKLNKKETVTAKKSEGVAIYSTKNVSWQGVGNISKGYNIVSEEEAARWQTRGHVRLATPEEVAAAYGK